MLKWWVEHFKKPEVERENINHCHRAEELEDYWFIPKTVITFFFHWNHGAFKSRLSQVRHPGI